MGLDENKVQFNNVYLQFKRLKLRNNVKYDVCGDGYL